MIYLVKTSRIVLAQPSPKGYANHGQALQAPLRWEKKEWLKAGEGLAIVVGTALLLDTHVRDASQRNRSPGTDKVAKQIQNFGASYSIGVIGGFWAYGKLAGDSEAVHTGLDAAEASLITGAVISPLLKSAIGRSRPSSQEGALLGSLVGRTVVLRNGQRRGGPGSLKLSLASSFGPGYQGAALTLQF